MSMLGKVFAILNVFAAAGLLYLAAVDYAKRQTWMHANLRADLLINGLPTTEQQRDRQGVAIAEQIPEPMLRELFAQAGQPVKTQVAEVERVRGVLEGKLSEAADKRKQLALYARYLMPFATTYLQRENFASYQTHLADEKAAAALKAQLQAAYNQAQAAVKDTGAKLPDAFAQAALGQPGEPRKPFVDALVAVFTADPARPFDAAFEASLDAQHAALKSQFDGLFQRAIQGPDPSRKERAPQEHREAIARLLFNVVEVLPPPDAAAGQPAPGAVSADILQVEGYRRFLAVVGLESAIATMNAQALVLAPIIDEVNLASARDRTTFVASHSALLTQARDLAERVVSARADLDRAKTQASKQEELVKKRQADVKQAREDLDAARAVTAQRLAELRQMSQALYNIRIEVREATAANQDRVKKIVELEEAAQKRSPTTPAPREDRPQ